MKKTALFLILIITALSICACGKNKASYDVQKGNVKNTGTVNESNTAKYELTDILNNKIPFTDESGKSVYLKNYRSEKYPDLQITPEKYAIVDLDNDGTNELVLYVSPKFGLYLVFHEYNGVIYSFEFTERAMIDLKQNGSFIQSSGAAINSYVILEFDKNTYKIIEEAYCDDFSQIYRINSKECGLKDINYYKINFNNKSNVEWNISADTSIYTDILDDLKAKLSDSYYFIKDIDEDNSPDLLVLNNTKLSVYSYEKSARLIGEQDFLTGTVRFFSSDNSEYPGIFYFTVGGGVNHYGYMSIKNQKLFFEDLCEENYASESTDNTENTKELSADKELIEESKQLYKNNSDIDFIHLK